MAKKNSEYRLDGMAGYEESRMHFILTLLPIILFGAVTILIVRAHYYTDSYSQFFWTTNIFVW